MGGLILGSRGKRSKGDLKPVKGTEGAKGDVHTSTTYDLHEPNVYYYTRLDYICITYMMLYVLGT